MRLNIRENLLVLFILISYALHSNVYFVHIPKTGGGSLCNAISTQLHESEVVKIACRVYGENGFKIYKKRNFNKYKLIKGHIPASFFREMDPTFDKAFKVTILRDPVQRFCSNVNHTSLQTKKNAADLLKIVDSGNTTLYSNNYCKFYAKDFNLEGEALLESAKEELLKYDCVIFFENYLEEISLLFKRFELDLDPSRITVLNKYPKISFTSSQTETIKRLNELDIKLYEWAKIYLKKKNSLYSLKSSFPRYELNAGEGYQYNFLLPMDGCGWGERNFLNYRGESFCCRSMPDTKATLSFPLKKKEYSIEFEGFAPENFSNIKLYVDEKEIVLNKVYHVLMEKTPIYLTTLDHINRKTKPGYKKFLKGKTYSFKYQGILPKDCINNPKTELIFSYDGLHNEIKNLYEGSLGLYVCRLSKIRIIPID